MGGGRHNQRRRVAACPARPGPCRRSCRRWRPWAQAAMKPLGTVRLSNALHSCPTHSHQGVEPSQAPSSRRQAAGGMRQGNTHGRQAHRKARLQQQARLQQASFQQEASPSTVAAPACMSCCSRRSGLTVRIARATPWIIEGAACPGLD